MDACMIDAGTLPASDIDGVPLTGDELQDAGDCPTPSSIRSLDLADADMAEAETLPMTQAFHAMMDTKDTCRVDDMQAETLRFEAHENLSTDGADPSAASSKPIDVMSQEAEEPERKSGNVLNMLKARQADPSIPKVTPLVAVLDEADDDVLAAFNLRPGSQLGVVDPDGKAVPGFQLAQPVEGLFESDLAPCMVAVPLIVADASLTSGGRAIFDRLPSTWLDLSGRTDALSARCLFSSRRHEHSVFSPLGSDQLFTLPKAVQHWQPACDLPAAVLQSEAAADLEPFAVEVHPKLGQVRVLVRPGVLLHRVLRGGFALPRVRFSWRVVETALGSKAGASGAEFSLLSNIEDAEHSQPPSFKEYSLRPEQRRSLDWMFKQERRRTEPFVSEFRDSAPFQDMPQWRLEVRLWCEYSETKGGVLGDAIGYGKTACTIGLVDCTRADPIPRVPVQAKGFIPSRATLVLVPTNLHSQWIREIQKFTGDTLKVLSIPTCSQLKSLTPEQISQADVVVATYRLFYSRPYLRRLEEIVRETKPGFSFPKFPSDERTNLSKCRGGKLLPAGLSHAYRTAFEHLPTWAAGLSLDEECTGKGDPITPNRAVRQKASNHTPEAQAPPVKKRRIVGKKTVDPVEDQVPEPSKRRRASKKQGVKAADAEEIIQVSDTMEVDAPAKARKYIPLEAFWWKRVVCDEFHELISHYPPAQTAVELFRSDYKWGLSGTPPCGTLQQLRKTASFFGVALPGAPREDDAHPEGPRQVAQHWLDAFVRSNTAEIEPFEEEERIVPVQQSPKERALYLALTEQHQTQQDIDAETVACSELNELRSNFGSTTGLLQLCSHFSLSGAAEVVTAEGECERVLARRRLEVSACERELASHVEKVAGLAEQVRHFEPHFMRDPVPEDFKFLNAQPKATLAARLRLLGASTTGAKPEMLQRLFESLRLSAGVSEDLRELALREDLDPKASPPKSSDRKTAPSSAFAAVETMVTDKADPSPVAATVRTAWQQAVERQGRRTGIPKACVQLRKTLGMPRAQVFREDDDSSQTLEDKQACAVLMRFWLDTDSNTLKLRNAVQQWKAELESCSKQVKESERKAAAKIQSLHFFEQTLREQGQVEAGSVAGARAPAVEEESKLAKYGTKIQTLVQHLQKTQQKDKDCKMIIFVQWESLKRNISAALEEFGVEHVVLQGSVWARRAALTKFQYNSNGPRALLLSLEDSASGTNLTAANHVYFVHPMEASTCNEAVAFEMQAIGRVRRPGQEKKIFIWRFVTMGTVEEELTKAHQQDLWERQMAAKTISSQLNPQVASAESASEDDMDDAVVGAKAIQVDTQ